MSHTWEVSWFNGDEWDSCYLHTLDNNVNRVREVFISQQYEGETCESITVTYDGLEDHSDGRPLV